MVMEFAETVLVCFLVLIEPMEGGAVVIDNPGGGPNSPPVLLRSSSIGGRCQGERAVEGIHNYIR